MSKSRFEAAKKKTGGASAAVRSSQLREMSAEEIRQEAYENRIVSDASPAEMSTSDSRRQALLAKMGYDFAHVDDLQPHPENDYSIDPESIENLAAAIYESGNTEALLVRNMGPGEKSQILAGERRWRAHQLLRERYGEAWSMVPVRNMGTMTDKDALFVLHSDNMAQRVLSPSERAKGYSIIADRITKQRETDPAFKKKYKGVRTRDILAEQFGVSSSTVSAELTISNRLVDEGKELLDEGTLSKMQALDMARLPEEQQHEAIEAITAGEGSRDEIDDAIQTAKTGDDAESGAATSKTERKQKTVESLVKNARNSLRKAVKFPGRPSAAMIGEIKELIIELDKRVDEDLKN